MNALVSGWGWDPQLASGTLLVAVLCSVSCALVGCYLVLRRMSLLGDAISHAVLPGVGLAFLLTHSRGALPMFLGALVFGLLTAVLTRWLAKGGKVSEDSSLGAVFTSLFALGVILVSVAAHDVHLDPGCVLYGLLEFAPLDTVSWGGWEIPRTALPLMAVAVLNLSVIVLLYKELKVVSFDEAFANAVGVSAGLIHYVLMGTVALTAVASFEAVGSILVVAMLIVPGATAHLLTDKLSRMLWISAGVAVMSAVGGYALAVKWNTSVAGAMSVAAGLQFFAAALLGPRHGWLGQKVRRWGLKFRILAEDALAMMYRWQERGMARPLTVPEVRAALRGGWAPAAAVWWLTRRGELATQGPHLVLTETGRLRAASLVRTHRLWESYLAKYLGLPADHVHQPAEEMEHFVTPDIRRELEEKLKSAKKDPHGSKIP